MSALHLDRITVRYGRVTVLEDLSLSVPWAGALGIVGESGSGKSTAARAACGLVPLSGGQVLIDGKPLRARRGIPSPVQMIFQNPAASLDPRLTVAAAIAEALPRGRPANEVLRYLDLVGLEAVHATRRPAELSGGQRQRVAIARALAAEPKVLIGDEITSALDVSVQAAILNLLRRLRQELGFTLLFISHNIAAVRYLCDDIAVMQGGRLVEAGPADQITRAPTQPYTRALLDAVPRLKEDSPC
ncbi:ABC transporter ATP-binding protein [Sphingoaurantiacus capsulatus]|uniref:ABC transporter ATP-binding protein n=1 Tax=Sphingoaurantiacus capsulatus TaxID=1771310 RepID=A0ABV7XDU8_9SPHN